MHTWLCVVTKSCPIFSSSPSDSYAFSQCLQLASGLHEAQQFVDLGSFAVRCLVCRAGLRGEKEAREHAMATGHQNFAQN